MRITDYICYNDFVGDTFVNWACLFVSERMGNDSLAQTKGKTKSFLWFFVVTSILYLSVLFWNRKSIEFWSTQKELKKSQKETDQPNDIVHVIGAP